MNLDMLHKILKSMEDEKEGISSYFLAQRMNLPEQKVRYYLEKAKGEELVSKQEANYMINPERAHISDGLAILYMKSSPTLTILIDESVLQETILDCHKKLPVVINFRNNHRDEKEARP